MGRHPLSSSQEVLFSHDTGRMRSTDLVPVSSDESPLDPATTAQPRGGYREHLRAVTVPVGPVTPARTLQRWIQCYRQADLRPYVRILGPMPDNCGRFPRSVRASGGVWSVFTRFSRTRTQEQGQLLGQSSWIISCRVVGGASSFVTLPRPYAFSW